MDTQNEQPTEDQRHPGVTLSAFEVLSLNKFINSLESQHENLKEEHEDLEKRFTQIKALYAIQEGTISRQSERLKVLTDQNEKLTELSMTAESIFMGKSSVSEQQYLKNLYHARFNGVHVPRVNQILTGDYSMDNTQP
jgi:hypothetical protein